METVPERSRKSWRVTFTDDDGEVVAPTTIRYRVHDEDSGTELVAWTAVTPSGRVTITIPASANRILDNTNTREIKVLTVQSDESTDNQQSSQERYQVLNLSGFTS
jgi:hypothetical protein